MAEPTPLTVTDLTRQVKDLVEGRFARVFVQGEVSNMTRASSGHVYLTLKDDQAQIRAVMWRSRASRLKFDLHDGLEVVASGAVELYQARGTLQLIVNSMQPQGIGALELAFRQMQERLAAEGLFAPERKRPLPRFPRRIALVTSPTGAAVRDMLQVMTRRWHGCDVVLLPVPVQGEGAAAKIAQAINLAPRIPDVDVIVTGRGGGSLEDLWAFNEEVVARAIAAAEVPVICAVGHEIDVSIADMVADRRALTPSEAGELVVPLQSEVQADLERLQSRLVSGLRERAEMARVVLDSLAARRVFVRPLERIHELTTRVDELGVQLPRALRRRLGEHRQSVAALAGALDALSPLKVLGRGYSITRDAATGAVIRDADQAHIDTDITTELGRGRISSRITGVEPPDDN